ncbi:MAG: hypothetical protein LBC07_00815 [Elusimicrobiota bacterium]|jgi:hypothetical protein|nr:hypothetical protein [Elusimicrobiota bacterium]
MAPSKIGKITIPYGANPQDHEITTAKFLNKFGFDVEFLIPIDENCVKTADIKMNGLLWEIKSPKGDGKYTIEHILRKASKKSNNIIVDLRRTKMSDYRSLSQIEKFFKLIRNIKILWVITKSAELLDFKKP